MEEEDAAARRWESFVLSRTGSSVNVMPKTSERSFWDKAKTSLNMRPLGPRTGEVLAGVQVHV